MVLHLAPPTPTLIHTVLGATAVPQFFCTQSDKMSDGAAPGTADRGGAGGPRRSPVLLHTMSDGAAPGTADRGGACQGK